LYPFQRSFRVYFFVVFCLTILDTFRIAEQAKVLHKRLGDFVSYLGDLRTALDKSIQGYNRAVGSFDGRVMPAVRKLQGMVLGNGELTLPETIALQARLSTYERSVEQNGNSVAN
jgi:DNA anti-recombination protein RmuC